MTTTPTIWKEKYTVNFDDTADGQQRAQSIGLANGNILVVWEDTDSSYPYDDLAARIFDPLGNPVGEQFYVENAGPRAGRPVLAALDSGGFLVAFRYYTPSDGQSRMISVLEFDENGQHGTERLVLNVLLDENGPNTSWDLGVLDADGDFVIAYEEHQNVLAKATDWGPTHTKTAQNSDDQDHLNGISLFPNGNIVCLSYEPDDTGLFGDTYQSVEVRITSRTGAEVRGPIEIAGGEDHAARGDDVAVLSATKFVALYHYSEGASRIAFRIGTVVANGVDFTGEISVADFASPQVQQSSVVALDNGGFFVAWIRGQTLFGTRYDVNGNVVGDAALAIARSVSADREALGQLSLTQDGRILITFQDGNGEIAQAIVDPRDNLILGTEDADTLTTQNFGTFLFGEGGDDRLLGAGAGDFIFGGDGNDTISGGGGGDQLTGDAGRDSLNGGEGNDLLNGGTGLDSLLGGVGDDTYLLTDVVQTAGAPVPRFAYDTVTEAAGEGRDTVVISAVRSVKFAPTSYTLGANIEYGRITAAADFGLNGNELDNVLAGNGYANLLRGFGGQDRLEGGLGNDTYVLDDGNDTVVDTGGVDTIISSISRSLSGYATIENLVLAGTGNINGNGNGLANSIHGTDGVNVLTGGAGIDTLYGKLGNDSYVLGADADLVVDTGGVDRILSTVGRTLVAYADVENLTLQGTANINGTGNALANILVGNDGDNMLNGLGGVDRLMGGLGNDTYVLAGDSDTVTDSGGFDSITSTVTRSLADYTGIERLILAGAADINGAGDGFGNVLIGNGGRNTLAGGDGGDTLVGGLGRDIYVGGRNNDIFDFNAVAETGNDANTRDAITDFTRGQDRIDLSTIDANAGLAGDQAFSFLAGERSGFTGVAGQLRWFYNDSANNALDQTIIVCDINGDRAGDFQIQLTGLISLTAADFSL